MVAEGSLIGCQRGSEINMLYTRTFVVPSASRIREAPKPGPVPRQWIQVGITSALDISLWGQFLVRSRLTLSSQFYLKHPV
jgi:hypothetical protein